VSLTGRTIPLTHDLVAIASSIADQAWTLLFDSGNAEHPNSHYDILCYQPSQTFALRGNQIEITTGHDLAHPTAAHANPQIKNTHQPAANWQAVLRSAMASLPAYDGPSDLPFQGGIAGAFGYDFGRQLEHVSSVATADIDLPDMAVALYQCALIFDKRKSCYYLLAPTDLWQQHADFWLHYDTNAPLQKALSQTSPNAFRLTSAWQSNLSATDYQEKFAQVMQHLKAGDCYQINLAQRFSATFSGSSWQAYQRLRQTNRAPFSAFMQLPEGSILSVSPERFISLSEQGALETKPIKGTRRRDPDPSKDRAAAKALQQAPKDRAENVMIVDLLRNDFSRVSQPGSVVVPELFAIESFPAVHHLVSTVHAQLEDGFDMLDVIAASFPGGSITGAPKISAMNIIDKLEPHRRSFYCGSMGYLSQHGAADTSIMIRTLVCHQNQIYCWAGGGLVIDSEWQAEYQETFDKVQQILPVLTEFNQQTKDKACAS